MYINIPNYHKQLRELSLQRPYIIFLLIGKFWIAQNQEMLIILEFSKENAYHPGIL